MLRFRNSKIIINEIAKFVKMTVYFYDFDTFISINYNI